MNDTTTHAPVTAVAAIIVRDGKVCLIRSKKNGYVLTPGGRLEPGETLDEALIREIREETGLTVTRIGRLLGVDKQPTYTLYIVEADADGELVAGDDAAEAWWGTAEEVRDSAKPRDYPFILDVLRAQKKKQELEALDDAVRYVCASGRTSTTGSGKERLVVIVDAATDEEAWTKLTDEVRAWHGPPPERRRTR